MGVKERRLQEKETMKRLILDAAMELVSKKGLCSLTIRCLAEQIQYSPSIIYEYFENKEAICKELSLQICKGLLSDLKTIKRDSDPDKYLLNLIRANVNFLCNRPQGIELLTLVCFGPDQSQIPKDFLEIESLFYDALKKCNCKQLNSKAEFDAALDVIRSLHVGMLTLSKYQTSVAGLQRIGNSLENGIYALLKGWKS